MSNRYTHTARIICPGRATELERIEAQAEAQAQALRNAKRRRAARRLARRQAPSTQRDLVVVRAARARAKARRQIRARGWCSRGPGAVLAAASVERKGAV